MVAPNGWHTQTFIMAGCTHKNKYLSLESARRQLSVIICRYDPHTNTCAHAFSWDNACVRARAPLRDGAGHRVYYDCLPHREIFGYILWLLPISARTKCANMQRSPKNRGELQNTHRVRAREHAHNSCTPKACAHARTRVIVKIQLANKRVRGT